MVKGFRSKQDSQALIELLKQQSVTTQKTAQKQQQTGQISKDQLSVANTSQHLIQRTLSTQSKPISLSGSPKQSLKYSSPKWNQHSVSSTKSNTTEALSSSSTGSKKSSSIDEDEDYDYTSAINNAINNSTTEEENTSSTEVGAPGLPIIIGETMTTLAEVLAALSLLTELQGQLAAKESELEGTITAKDVQNVEDNLKAADTTLTKQLKKMSEEIDKARTMKIVVQVFEYLIAAVLIIASVFTGGLLLLAAGVLMLACAIATSTNCFGPEGGFTKLLESLGMSQDSAKILSAVFNMTLTIAAAVFMTLAMPGIGAGMAAVMIGAGVIGALASSNLIGVCMDAHTDSTTHNKEKAYEEKQQNAETSENINKWLGYVSLGLSVGTILFSIGQAIKNMAANAIEAVGEAAQNAVEKALDGMKMVFDRVKEAIQGSLKAAEATAETAGTKLSTNVASTTATQSQGSIQNASGNVEEVSSKIKDASAEVEKAEKFQGDISGVNSNVTSMVEQMNQLSESFAELQDAANDIKKAAKKILEELEQTGQSLQEQINKVKELLSNPSGTVAEGQTAGASEELSQAVEKLNKMTTAAEQQATKVNDFSKTLEDASKGINDIKNGKFNDLKPEEVQHLNDMYITLIKSETERLTNAFDNYAAARITIESLANTAETGGKLEGSGKSSSSESPSTATFEESTQSRTATTLEKEAENESTKGLKETVSRQETSANETVSETSTKAPTTDTSSTTKAPTDVPSSTKTPTDVPSSTKTPTDVPSSTKAPTDVPSSTKTPTTDTPSTTEVPTEKASLSSRFANNPVARAFRKYVTEGVKSQELKQAEEATKNEMKNLDPILNGKADSSANFKEAFLKTTGQEFSGETKMSSEELVNLKGSNGKTFQQNLQELNEETVSYRKALQLKQAEYTQAVDEGPSEAEEFITKQYRQSLLEKGMSPEEIDTEMANLEESAGYGKFKEDFTSEMETDPESIKSPPTSETGKSITQRFSEWLTQKGDETFEFRKQMVESLAFIVQGIGQGVSDVAQGAITIQQAKLEAKVKELGAQLELLEVERDILFMYMDMSSKELTKIESNYENWTSTVDQIYSSLNTMANQAV